MELVVSCKEELKAKVHIVVYTKEREEDEESVGLQIMSLHKMKCIFNLQFKLLESRRMFHGVTTYL